MIKNTAVVAGLLLGLIGCSSGGSSTPAATDAGTTDAGADSGGTDTGTTDTGTTDTGTTSSGGTGTDGNPGAVPSPIIAELTTLDLNVVSSVGGHKVFSGPGFRIFQEFEHVNMDFKCDNTGVYEYFSPPQFGVGRVSGTFTWTTPTGITDSYSVDPRDGTALAGDPDDLLINLSIDSITDGAIIVGSTYIENTEVSRIVQYEECN